MRSHVDDLFGGLGSVEEAPYVKVSDVKAEDADGGTFTQDAWRTRDMNTVDSDTDGICSLSSNQITLAAGTYECKITCPACQIQYHKARLYNTTGATTLIWGTSEYLSTTSSYATNVSYIKGKFTIAADQVLEIQHYCTTTCATFGFGAATDITGVSEVYTIAEFRKIETQLVMEDTYTATSTVAAIKTGTYTGDGSTAHAITGLGFQPKYVKIWIHVEDETVDKYYIMEKVDQTWGDYAIMLPPGDASDNILALDNRINSLDADGFTVDDDGADYTPNKNGITYDYLAIGEKSITAFNTANVPPYVKVSDTRANGTHGGTFTQDVWQTRVLNTEDTDTNNVCSLSSNQITLAAGTYECRIAAPGQTVGHHKAKLRNVTDSVDILIGTAQFTYQTADRAQTKSYINGRFTIAADKALEIQHRCQATKVTYGFGAGDTFGVSEVFTVAEFWKVA